MLTSASPQDISKIKAACTWMAHKLDTFECPTSVDRFSGGQSNPTFLLSGPTKQYVLRRKPIGATFSGAHAIDREVLVTQALGRTSFPVPRVLMDCDDPSVLGASFYLMEYVRGRVFLDPSFSELPRERRGDYMFAMNRTLAALHSIGYEEIGLLSYGKPQDYVARQISRWSKQYKQDEVAGRSAAMDELCKWLPRNLPPSNRRSIVHGDFRVDNLIFDPQAASVIAVLDWELSTLGDPLADFAYHLMMYRLPPEILGGIGHIDPAQHGVPTEQEYADLYLSTQVGGSSEHLDYLIAFSMFKFAAILHGIRARSIRGNASNANADRVGASFEILAGLALEQARRST